MLLRFLLRHCSFIHYHWNGKIPSFLRHHKNIVMIHDVLPLEIPDFFSSDKERKDYITEIKNTLSMADVILTPSKYSKKQILKEFSPNKTIYVLPHGVTVTRADTNVKKSDYYIYVGGYDKRKGLIPLLKEFIASTPRRKLCFVGEINYFSNEFENLCKTAMNMGILKQYGYVSEHELADLILHAQALIYPSLYEGFGLPPIEAMALGTPVFTTRGTCLPEICGNSAIYFDPNTPGDLIKKLDDFEREDHTDLIKHGKNHAKKFNWTITAKQYNDILMKDL